MKWEGTTFKTKDLRVPRSEWWMEASMQGCEGGAALAQKQPAHRWGGSTSNPSQTPGPGRKPVHMVSTTLWEVRKAAVAAEDKGPQTLEKDVMKNSPPALELGELELFQTTSWEKFQKDCTSVFPPFQECSSSSKLIWRSLTSGLARELRNHDVAWLVKMPHLKISCVRIWILRHAAARQSDRTPP